MNKITKDRYLPVGPELPQSSQLIDISGEKMQLLLDFPTVGEPHYAQAIPASALIEKSKRIYSLEENKHEFATRMESEAKVVRKGKDVHVYMTAVRSHLTPDNIEGVRVGDTVYFHLTNLEQDWDIAHGFTIFGSNSAELLLMPGETATMKFEAKEPGIYPFYCTDFCSALHQEMQGYLRVSDTGANVPLKWIADAKDKGAPEKEPSASEQKAEGSANQTMSPSKGVGPITEMKVDAFNVGLAKKGLSQFQAKCSACHKVDERFVGPALKGVTRRRQPEWILNMILNPSEMTQKDPVAKELLGEYLVQMANQNLTKEEARAVLEYLRQVDGAK